MNEKRLLKIHVELGGLREDFEGSPDEVIRALLTALSETYPSLEVASKLVFQPDLAHLAENLVGCVEFAPEGVLVLPRDVPSEEAIIISLVGSYVGYRLGRIDEDTDSASGIARTTGKALKTISNQLAWMVDEGLVERIERGKYRISSFGIKRFTRIIEKSRLREGVARE